MKKSIDVHAGAEVAATTKFKRMSSWALLQFILMERGTIEDRHLAAFILGKRLDNV